MNVTIVANTGLRAWSARQWLVALASSVAFTALVAIPTDLINTPYFSREIPPTWWSWPALVLSACLSGLLIATYVAPSGDEDTKVSGGGYAAGLLTFFAVGCPVCNKLVLVALGSAGALTWFQPLQPVLQVLAIGLLAWGLRQRVAGKRVCATSTTPELSPSKERL